MFGRFAQRFYSPESPATESPELLQIGATGSPELLQMVGATAKQFNEYAGFIASVSVIGGGAIQLTKMTKDQMKEVVKPIEEKVDENSESVNQKLEKMQSQFCQFAENIGYIKAKLDNNSKK